MRVRRYRILDTIVLGFIEGREQVEAIYDAGPFQLECDGHTIWVLELPVFPGDKIKRIESITDASVIPVWLREDVIVEIGWCDTELESARSNVLT